MIEDAMIWVFLQPKSEWVRLHWKEVRRPSHRTLPQSRSPSSALAVVFANCFLLIARFRRREYRKMVTNSEQPLPATAARDAATIWTPAEAQGKAPGRGRLQGCRILVVGAGSQPSEDADPPIGNGRAIAVLCAREGAAVACVDK